MSATVSAALCTMSVSPAMAQNYAFSGFDAPRGATATANLRVPLGREAKARPTYGLAFGYGKAMGPGSVDGRVQTRQLRFADFRFGESGLERAQLAGFNLADPKKDRRMNLTGEGNTLWIVVGLVAAGVAVCLLADCFEGDDDDSSSSSN